MTEIGKKAIIKSIRQDAKNEAKEIVKKAKQTAAERLAFLDTQLKNIKSDAEKYATEQAETIKTRIFSGLKVEKKRKILAVRGEILDTVLDGVYEQFKQRMQKPDYADDLLRWIVEAAIGLDAEQAMVNVSVPEQSFMTVELLKKAEKQVLKLGGKTVHLKLAQAPPLKKQGVVLTAVDGRTAFDNRISTRIKRHHREIQNIVYELIKKTGDRV